LLAGCLVAGLAAGFAHAAGLPGGEPKLLPPEQAFRFSARALGTDMLEARFDVADGYYLYRDKLSFTLEPAELAAGTPVLPDGKRKHDEFFGDVETYRGRVVVRVPLARAAPGGSITLKAASQGCADAGVCYPPTLQQVRLALPAAGSGPGPVVEAPRRKGLFE
jgi:thiol:disulfide interchange protein DsbD